MIKSKLIITINIIMISLLLASNTYASNNLFNTVEFKSNSFKSLPKWVELLDKMVTEKSNVNKCYKNKNTCDNKFILEWLEFIKTAKNIKDKQDLLNTVNSFFNDWEYTLDIDNWNLSDYWEIPSEFLEFSGDCEDYAIIKYYTLKALGFDVDKMRIVIVKDTVRNGAHAILAVYLNNEIFVLDNLSTVVLPENIFTQYSPYYSLNENHKWLHFKKL